MTKHVFCIMGPTASGKTELACKLLKQLPLEIISVDSAMIYRGMDIGTAKPDEQLLKQAPHHLINILDPPESYSAALFCEDATTLCHKIHDMGKIPLLVGGTMLYFRALQQGLSTLPTANEEIRAAILAEATQQGWEHMHQILGQIDPITAARVHPNDQQRIQRALEVYQLTNLPLSTFLSRSQRKTTFHFSNIMLLPNNRTWLHQRIAERFEQMVKAGLVDEVASLIEKWPLTLQNPSMRTVGYRQVLLFLQGHYDKVAMQEAGIAATRQLAKRQLTWLRSWPEGLQFSAEQPPSPRELVAIMRRILDNNAD